MVHIASPAPGSSGEAAIATDIDGHLLIDGCRSSDLALEFGTPTWVISEQAIRANYRRLRDAFAAEYPDTVVAFAAKANSQPAVIAIAASEGALVDVVSLGHAK